MKKEKYRFYGEHFPSSFGYGQSLLQFYSQGKQLNVNSIYDLEVSVSNTLLSLNLMSSK